MSQDRIFSIIDKAVFDYRMINENDRILVGASGGKDSTVLIHYLAERKKQKRENFDFTALHIKTEIAPPLSEELVELFKKWDVDLKIIDISVLERLKEGKKMNCWWCSTQRRTELNQYAISNNYNKIALGHHLDDILETAVMNIINKGELSTMPPVLKYQKYPVTVIRPLCLVDVDTIIDFAKSNNYISSVCTCNYQDNSARKTAREKLKNLAGTTIEKQHFFNALRNVNREYLTYLPEKEE